MKRRRQRRCRGCREKFYPDYRQKDRQWHCPKPSCQIRRHNKNVRDWYLKNPQSLDYQKQQTRQWFKEHPDYQKSYRLNHPDILQKNRVVTKKCMSRLRSKKLFEKMNSMFSELLHKKGDRCYLNARSGWVYLRLIKQTRYARYGRLCQNLGQMTRRMVRHLGKKVYDLVPITGNKKAPT